MEMEHAHVLFSYFGLNVNVEGLKHIRGRGSVIQLHNVNAYRNANVFSDIADFSTITIPETAERIWDVVVSGINALAKWVMSDVQDLWERAVDVLNDVVDAVKIFLKKYWNNTPEFVKRIQQVQYQKVKDHMRYATLKATNNLRDIALERMKIVLQENGYDIDGCTEEEIREKWDAFMKAHPLTPEEEEEAKKLLG